MTVPPNRPESDATEPNEADAAVAALRELMLTSHEFRRAVAHLLRIATNDTFAMSYLAARGPLPPIELARHLGLTPSGVTTVIDRLEAAGIAERQQRADDRRSVMIALTADGNAAVARTRGWMTDALLSLGPDIAALGTTLEHLTGALRVQIAEVNAADMGDPPERRSQ